MSSPFEIKVNKLLDKLQRFDELKEESADLVVKDDMPDLVRGQLANGVNGDGRLIQSGYSRFWGAVRSAAGLQIAFVDLRFSGTFYRSLRVVESGNEYVLKSNVPYAPDLLGRYPKILNLTDDNFNEITRQIRIDLVSKIVGNG